MSRFTNFRFGPQPTVGDRLLSGATGCTIALSRSATDDEVPPEIEYTLHGSVQLSGDEAGELLQNLIAAFRTPRQEGGAA